MYSLTYVLISTMVFGKFSVLRKKAICTKGALANIGGGVPTPDVSTGAMI